MPINCMKSNIVPAPGLEPGRPSFKGWWAANYPTPDQHTLLRITSAGTVNPRYRPGRRRGISGSVDIMVCLLPPGFARDVPPCLRLPSLRSCGRGHRPRHNSNDGPSLLSQRPQRSIVAVRSAAGTAPLPGALRHKIIEGTPPGRRPAFSLPHRRPSHPPGRTRANSRHPGTLVRSSRTTAKHQIGDGSREVRRGGHKGRLGHVGPSVSFRRPGASSARPSWPLVSRSASG